MTDNRNYRPGTQLSLAGLYCCFWKLFYWGRLQRNLYLLGTTLNPFTLKKGEEITVWIDPLDATHEYIEGKKNPSLLEYVTVMICIAVRGIPIAGIINQPFSNGITKWAWLEHGISDTLKADTIDKGTSEDFKVTYSRSHAGKASEVVDAAFKQDGFHLVHVPAAGSGYKTLQVVERKSNLYLHVTEIKKWDICAGNAILNTVGGKMTTLKGQEIDYSFNGSPLNKDGLIAAMPESAHQKYLDKVKFAT